MLCLASGCTSSQNAGNDALTAEQVAARYGYDAKTATHTPVYALVPEFEDPRANYAGLLLLQDCMAGKIVYKFGPPEADSPGTLFDPRSRDRRFTPEIAATWGYQVPSQRGEQPDFLDPNLSGEKLLEMELECGKTQRPKLDPPSSDFLEAAVGAGWGATNSDEETRVATKSWRQCMAPVGVVDLPETPTEMPSPSVAATPPPDTSVTASAREREIAVADAKCRDSSGYNTAVRESRTRGELEAIGKDIESFEASRVAFADYAKRVEKVIADLG